MNEHGIGWAVKQLRDGKMVRRAGWNGKGMWLALMGGTTIQADLVNARTKAHGVEGDLQVGAYIVIWTAQGTWQPGWHASQPDLLAIDWELAE